MEGLPVKTTITTLLLDADGVIQHNPHFASGMWGLMGGDVPLEDLYELERPSLDGSRDLRDDVHEFLQRHGSQANPDDVLDVWHETYVIPQVLDVVDQVRAGGIPVYLASNQQRRRGELMIAEKNYQNHFDGFFYSYQMGVAKPDTAYFQAIIDQLDCTPAHTLFVDDIEENVMGARELGIIAEVFDRDSGAAGLEAVLRAYDLLPPGQIVVNA